MFSTGRARKATEAVPLPDDGLSVRDSATTHCRVSLLRVMIATLPTIDDAIK